MTPAKGDAGAAGAIGATGAQGPQGPAGADGTSVGSRLVTGLCGQVNQLLTNNTANIRTVMVTTISEGVRMQSAYVNGVLVAAQLLVGQPVTLTFAVPPWATYEATGDLCYYWSEWQ